MNTYASERANEVWDAALKVYHQPNCGWTVAPPSMRVAGGHQMFEQNERELCTCGLARLMRLLGQLLNKPGIREVWEGAISGSEREGR